jgi:hypothetical protein
VQRNEIQALLSGGVDCRQDKWAVTDELTAAILVRPLEARAQGSAPVPEGMPFDIP